MDLSDYSEPDAPMKLMNFLIEPSSISLKLAVDGFLEEIKPECWRALIVSIEVSQY